MFDVLQLQIHSALSNRNSQICTYRLSKFHKSVFLIGHDNLFVVDAVTDSPKSNHKYEFRFIAQWKFMAKKLSLKMQCNHSRFIQENYT